MEKIEDLLRLVRKTNPEMTKEKLMEELKKSVYATKAIILSFQNSF